MKNTVEIFVSAVFFFGIKKLRKSIKFIDILEIFIYDKKKE